jgi:hypothetical protein
MPLIDALSQIESVEYVFPLMRMPIESMAIQKTELGSLSPPLDYERRTLSLSLA